MLVLLGSSSSSGRVWAGLTAGLRSHFINQSSALLTVPQSVVYWLRIFCVKSIKLPLQGVHWPDRSGSFLPVCDNHVSHSVSLSSPRLTSDPKATNPGWLVFVAPGCFPGIQLNRILRSPNIFLWQTHHFLVIPNNKTLVKIFYIICI